MNLTIEQNPSRLNLYVDVKRQLVTYFFVMNLDLITPQGRVYQSFFHRHVDMCHFFLNPGSDVVFSMVYGELSKSGRFMRKCPVEKVI